MLHLEDGCASGSNACAIIIITRQSLGLQITITVSVYGESASFGLDGRLDSASASEAFSCLSCRELDTVADGRRIYSFSVIHGGMSTSGFFFSAFNALG